MLMSSHEHTKTVLYIQFICSWDEECVDIIIILAHLLISVLLERDEPMMGFNDASDPERRQKGSLPRIHQSYRSFLRNVVVGSVEQAVM
jgi:hypothetical protein